MAPSRLMMPSTDLVGKGWGWEGGVAGAPLVAARGEGLSCGPHSYIWCSGAHTLRVGGFGGVPVAAGLDSVLARQGTNL